MSQVVYKMFEKNLSQERFVNKKSIYKQLEQSSLCICTHNGTVMLESLSLNIPTVIFFNPYYWELNDEAICFYEKLHMVYDTRRLCRDRVITHKNHRLRVRLSWLKFISNRNRNESFGVLTGRICADRAFQTIWH